MVESKVKGEEAKEKGNDAFRKGHFAEAVGFYTEAVLADATNPVYYLNRSMAYMKLNNYDDAERDGTAALRLGGGNVKAYFRRGTARKQLSKWKEAKEDFEMVMGMDSSNAEAKLEIAVLKEKLAAMKKASKSTPLDAGNLSKPPKEVKARPSNSVEAARNFLEKVGMSDEQGSATPASSNTIPDRFPGETGSFLKEVSTRRLVKRKEEPTAFDTMSLSGSLPKSAENISTASPTQKDTLQILPQSGARYDSLSKGSSGEVRLSAYEFYRRLRQCSANQDACSKASTQLELLASLEVAHIPSMLGSLLEPELLTDILEALSQTDETQTSLLVDIMSVLPLCERFGTACMFLEQHERQRAISLLEKIRKEESSAIYDRVASLWKVQI